LGKLKTFEADEASYKKFKEVCLKEGVDMGAKLNEFIKKYNKEFGDGNPVYQITQWFENSGMKAVPALFRDKYAWGNYINALSDKEFRELESQNLMVTNLLSMKFQHGDALARVI